MNEVVAHSVDLGYRVIDEYIRQGQKAAQRFTDRSFSPDSMTGDAQELGARMAQYASDFTALWMEAMQLGANQFGANVGRWPMSPADAVSAANGPRPATSKPAPPPPDAAKDADSGRTRVRVAVTSPHPTEVLIDLRPIAAGQRLAVHALRAVAEGKPRLTDVSLEQTSADAPLTLRIRVPARQPAGVYNGLIVDEETGKPMGTVSLQVLRK